MKCLSIRQIILEATGQADRDQGQGRRVDRRARRGAFSGSEKGETTAVGKLAGMGTGAAIGAGVGTVVSAATPGPSVTIPAEAQMDFYLASPISVVPVSAKEAARLAQGYHHGGPVLYVRGDTP